MIRAAVRKVGVYMYCLPTFRQSKLVIWDSITNDGKRFLDFIPSELIASTNGSELKITLTNGSIIQLIGSDSYDTALVGTNPRMVIFSEFALADSRALSYVRPILNANGGTMMIISTPRGHNHLFELYQIAKESDDWFCYKLTLDDTQHIPIELIEREIASGEISEDLVQQEYYTSFDLGIEGSYYTKYIDKLRLNGQITDVMWEPSFPVHTVFDLGYNDPTVILFVQVIGQSIRIIDTYSNNKQGLEHYAKILHQKPYSYGKHIAPHDIAVHDLGSGISRWKVMYDLGIKFERDEKERLPRSIEDGIEAVRRNLPKMWIDQTKCKEFIKAIENYRQEYDNQRKIYKPNPLHDWTSHYADALRYLCVALPRLNRGTSPEDLDKRYREAMFGENNYMPAVFRDDLPNF